MPELPEVETTVRGLKKRVLGRTFIRLWTDWPKIVKRPSSFSAFKKALAGKKIIHIRRRAKNVVMDLSDGYSLLIHQKMTGHLLHGAWSLKQGTWVPDEDGPMKDPYNRFLHIIFFLDDKKMIALCDLRKFAKVELWKTEELEKELEKLGPEPLEKSFTFDQFKAVLAGKKNKIKVVLMDPAVMAGVGNIYANEALWMAKIHPHQPVSTVPQAQLKALYESLLHVLTLGVDLGGESFSDYRKVDGTHGDFDSERNVYQREGEKCPRCKKNIKRIMFAGRSSFMCPVCQKLK